MESTFDLKPNQLARLLAMGERDEKGIDERSGGERLAGERSGDAAEEILRDLLREPVELLETQGPIPPGDLLLDTRTGLAELAGLKDRAKGLVLGAKSEPEKAAATAFYYAAIAAALVLYGRRITQLSFEAIDDALAKLEGEPWVPPELADLFARARGVCRTQR